MASAMETAGRMASAMETAGNMALVAETAGSTSNSDDSSLGDDTGCGSFSSYRGDSDDGSFGSDDSGDVALEDDTALESFALDHRNPLLGLLNRNSYC
jgi:hypothetical protein